MILSVSRRTDIPNYYSEWFYNRVKEGFLYVRNPMNAHQISRISLAPELVDCIVFWSKNPSNMIARLDELGAYNYCFHFTITGYARDIEPFIADKREELRDVFRRLSEKIGCEKMIWRYDPVFVNDRYHLEYHLRAFEETANYLRGYTGKVFVSFVDFYKKTKRNTKDLNIKDLNKTDIAELLRGMAGIAKTNRIDILTCAAQSSLADTGIKQGGCIDKTWIQQIVGYNLKGRKDKSQREACRCIQSVDVGTYNTCRNGCKYCYANFNEEKVRGLTKLYDVNSPLLCGSLQQGGKEIITERKLKSLKGEPGTG